MSHRATCTSLRWRKTAHIRSMASLRKPQPTSCSRSSTRSVASLTRTETRFEEFSTATSGRNPKMKRPSTTTNHSKSTDRVLLLVRLPSTRRVEYLYYCTTAFGSDSRHAYPFVFGARKNEFMRFLYDSVCFGQTLLLYGVEESKHVPFIVQHPQSLIRLCTVSSTRSSVQSDIIDNRITTCVKVQKHG